MVSSGLIVFFIAISSSSICAEGTCGRKEEVDISPVWSVMSFGSVVMSLMGLVRRASLYARDLCISALRKYLSNIASMDVTI